MLKPQLGYFAFGVPIRKALRLFIWGQSTFVAPLPFGSVMDQTHVRLRTVPYRRGRAKQRGAKGTQKGHTPRKQKGWRKRAGSIRDSASDARPDGLANAEEKRDKPQRRRGQP